VCLHHRGWQQALQLPFWNKLIPPVSSAPTEYGQIKVFAWTHVCSSHPPTQFARVLEALPDWEVVQRCAFQGDWK
jgi:hypothetical protein